MKVMLLDGQYSHSLPIAAELSRELRAEVLGVAPSRRSHLHRSRYLAKRLIAPLATDPGYVDRILELIELERPQVVVPVGYYSYLSLISVRKKLPEGVSLLAPSNFAFEVAASKSATYELAERLGIDYPKDYTGILDEELVAKLPYPIFAKARLERGGESTALIRDAVAMEAFDADSIGGDYLLQEYIGAEEYTYAHSGFYVEGEPIATYQHKEIRSVPRRGGSGTRLQTYSDPKLEQEANKLLRELSWDGIAQVEFKRREDGSYVLMEINPKFWASYALASRAGARIAATAVAFTAGRSLPERGNQQLKMLEMVFPFREALHVITHLRDESVLRSVGAMMWPPAVWDADPRDLFANIPLRSGLKSKPKR